MNVYKKDLTVGISNWLKYGIFKTLTYVCLFKTGGGFEAASKNTNYRVWYSSSYKTKTKFNKNDWKGIKYIDIISKKF